MQESVQQGLIVQMNACLLSAPACVQLCTNVMTKKEGHTVIMTMCSIFKSKTTPGAWVAGPIQGGAGASKHPGVQGAAAADSSRGGDCTGSDACKDEG